MKQDIHTFVAECDTFQCNKGETIKSPSTIQLLLTPSTIWKNISMDFIVVLPKSRNKSVIMVVVDSISKYAHFFFLFNTHSPPPQLLKFLWIISSNSMACFILLFLTVIQLLPVLSGNNCLNSREPNRISAQHIILRLMDKLKRSTSVWKPIWGVLHPNDKISGLNSYP